MYLVFTQDRRGQLQRRTLVGVEEVLKKWRIHIVVRHIPKQRINDRVGNVGVSAPTGNRQTQAAPALVSGITTNTCSGKGQGPRPRDMCGHAQPENPQAQDGQLLRGRPRVPPVRRPRAHRGGCRDACHRHQHQEGAEDKM